MSIYKGNTLISGVNTNTIANAHFLFEAIWSDHLINHVSYLRADTFSWQSGSVYTTAYNHLVTDISGVTAETETIGSYTVTFYRATDGHKVVLADQETTVANIYTETGIAWYYILDTTNTQFKLPRTKWGFKGLRGNVGDNIAQTVLLPNITGGFYVAHCSAGGASGAFSSTDSGTANFVGQVSGKSHTFTFNASKSSSVYSGDGTDTLIDERATQMYLYFYVGEYSQTAIEQTAGITSEQLNNKLDTTTVHITQSYVNGTSGYNVWSNGYCEQWGRTYAANAWVSVSFAKSFKDTNYIVTASQIDTATSGTFVNAMCLIATSSTDSMYVSIYGNTATVGWKACGYLAEGEY